jgi:hypothetical protein
MTNDFTKASAARKLPPDDDIAPEVPSPRRKE